MCGIAGIVASESEQYQHPLKQMVNALSHRGPDASGTYFFPTCALGHTRLSIIDLSSGGQPMLSPLTDKIGITFNGEIYGYQSIKASLSDYPFRTTSDTEVILALYERYGDSLLTYLPGMFAFAIWDETRQQLWCARDRFGEKPFYYAFGDHGEFLFASEIKALLASGLVEPVLSREAVTHYLKHLYVHPQQTIYQNIYTLPPASRLCYQVGHQPIVERYWELPTTQHKIELAEATEQFKYLFDQAVAKQLVADVPVGTFLSGGLDSSSVVAMASRHQAKLKTFSFGFEESVSELPFADQVAKKYQTAHTILTDNTTNISDLLITMQEVYDEPFADSSNIPTYLISKLARQHVTVVLTGDGGDELLAGYSSWYKPLLYMQQENHQALWFTHLIRLTNKLLTKANLPPFWRDKTQGRLYQHQYSSVSQAHLNQNQYFTNAELAQFNLPISHKPTSGSWEATNTVDDAFRMDIQDYMPGDILVKIDRAAMAHGLELRAPFLDVDFASFCISLPFQLKINSEQDKIILRRAFAEAWPSAISTRAKQGFGAPVTRWLKQNSVKALKEQYLNDPRQKIFSLLPFNHTRPIVNKDNYQTWILLVLALWMDKHKFSLP